ncbi:cytochrome c3 family protein [Lutibacter sp.]
MFSQGLKSSHHDFSGASWSGNNYCKPCHTPHNATLNGANSPLWNHQLTNAVFETYTSFTLDGITGQPSGNTKLCLSCHDGTVAIDSHSGITNGTLFTSFGNLSSNLKNDHPISIIYDTALALTDGELHDPSTTPSGLGGTIKDDLLDTNNKLECTSCHDVHISRNTQGCIGCHNIHANGSIVTKTLSLWKDNDKSALCLTCHKK